MESMLRHKLCNEYKLFSYYIPPVRTTVLPEDDELFVFLPSIPNKLTWHVLEDDGVNVSFAYLYIWLSMAYQFMNCPFILVGEINC